MVGLLFACITRSNRIMLLRGKGHKATCTTTTFQFFIFSYVKIFKIEKHLIQRTNATYVYWQSWKLFFSLRYSTQFPTMVFWVFFLYYQFSFDFFANKNWLIHCKYVHILPAVALEFIYTCSILLIGKTPVDTYAVIRFQTLIENK